MPSISDFKKNQTAGAPAEAEQSEVSSATPVANVKTAKKRRPGRESVSAQTQATDVSSEQSPVPPEVKVIDVESPIADEKVSQQGQAHAEAPGVELNFPGSEILRAKFPKPFSVAEKVATNWLRDGDFADLQLSHPLAQVAAQKGLRRAKDLEKKIMSSPVTEKITMQAFTGLMRVQTLLNQVRDKVQRK